MLRWVFLYFSYSLPGIAYLYSKFDKFGGGRVRLG